MKKYDIVLLTEARYVKPENATGSVQNILDDDKLVTAALEAKGLRVTRVDWADPTFDWTTTKTALFRTTWDYFNRIDEFRQWLNKVKEIVRFINPIDLILWNLDKHYLRDLSSKGINIPETIFIEPVEQTTLHNLFLETGWPEAILKPAISGSARHTYRLSNGNLAEHETIFQELIAKETMLLQPLQHSVLKRGEVALMYFAGNYSHAVLKVARPGEFRVQNDFGGTVHDYTPTDDEIRFGERTLKACKTVPVYARVDIIDDNYDNPALIELELIEPELWFRLYPASAQALAKALIKYIN